VGCPEPLGERCIFHSALDICNSIHAIVINYKKVTFLKDYFIHLRMLIQEILSGLLFLVINNNGEMLQESPVNPVVVFVVSMIILFVVFLIVFYVQDRKKKHFQELLKKQNKESLF